MWYALNLTLPCSTDYHHDHYGDMILCRNLLSGSSMLSIVLCCAAGECTVFLFEHHGSEWCGGIWLRARSRSCSRTQSATQIKTGLFVCWGSLALCTCKQQTSQPPLNGSEYISKDRQRVGKIPGRHNQTHESYQQAWGSAQLACLRKAWSVRHSINNLWLASRYPEAVLQSNMQNHSPQYQL